VFIYFSSQQDDEEEKKKRKIDKDRVSVLKNSRVYKKERDIEQQTNNQTRSVCMKKKTEEESSRPRKNKFTHTHTHNIHP
jgi:precorrin-2 methylase